MLGNLQKVAAGGWVPLVFGASLYWIMRTWQSGRDAIHAVTSREDYTEAEFRRLLNEVQPQVVDKTVVFLTSHAARIPRTLVRNIQINRVLHARTIIMTMGVATANSVLVISFARQRLREGLTPLAAALDAGATRLRPVLMTAIAMILGMVPLAIGLGEGSEQNAPLGRAVIGGLLFATVSTVLFVPVLFAAFHERLAARRLNKELTT